MARRFRPFVEDELPDLARGSNGIVAHPPSGRECPRNLTGDVTLAIGPEGGWIANEIAMFERLGFEPVSLGPRILRVEAVIPTVIGRMF